MEKLLMIFVLCVAVRAVEDQEVPPFEKVSCSPDSSARSALIEDAKCGAPRNVFVVLNARAAHKEIYPGAVWVKRCVGLCEHEGSVDAKCMPHETAIRQIPVMISDMKTDKESCSLYPVEEHLSCQCTGSPESRAASGRVLNPRVILPMPQPQGTPRLHCKEPEYAVESF